MGKGSNQTSTTSTQPPKQFLDALNNALPQVQQTAGTPYTPYQGPQVAGFTQAQQNAFNNINNAQTAYQPYYQQATSALSGTLNPLQQFSNQAAQNYMDPYRQQVLNQVPQLNGQYIQQFQNPYTQQVVNATRANMQENNAQQQQGILANAIGSHALGNDRVGVAQSNLARQQKLADDQTIANLYNQGFNTALSTAQQQQGLQNQNLNQGYNTALAQFNQANANQLAQNTQAQNAAGIYAGLGNQALQNQLAGANAQLAAGNQQQQLAQQYLNVPYQSYLQQQQYPFQTTQYLSNLISQLSGAAGGTGTSTTPGASPLSQIGGLGLGIAGLAGKYGWLGLADGGAIGYADGGMTPFSGVQGFGGLGAPMQQPMVHHMQLPTPAPKQEDPLSMGSIAKNLAMFDSFLKAPTSPSPSGTDTNLQIDQPAPQGLPAAPNFSDPSTPWMNRQEFMGLASGGAVNPYYDGPDNEPDYDEDDTMEDISPSLLYNGREYPENMNDIEPDSMYDTYGQESVGGGAGNDMLGGLPSGNSVPMAANVGGKQIQLPPVSLPQSAGLPVTPLPAQDTLAGGAATDKPGWEERMKAQGIDPWMALMTTGFGMAAGQSPNALTNIASGGLAGVQNMQAQQQMAELAKERAARLLLEKQKMSQGRVSKDEYGAPILVNPYTGEATHINTGTSQSPVVTETGDKALSGVDANTASLVKQVVSGTLNPSQIRGQARNKILSLAEQYDPSFNALTIPTRAATVKSFTSGKDKDNIVALNTAIGHAATLAKVGEALNNVSLPLITPEYNAVTNAIMTRGGDTRVTNFNAAAHALAGELAKVFRGNTTALADVKSWQESLSPNMSPEQQKGALSTITKLMQSRIDEMARAYENGTGKQFPTSDFISHESQKVLAMLSGEVPQEASAPPPQAVSTAPKKPPVIGDIVEGHRYIGGNLNDPKSWVAAQ